MGSLLNDKLQQSDIWSDRQLQGEDGVELHHLVGLECVPDLAVWGENVPKTAANPGIDMDSNGLKFEVKEAKSWELLKKTLCKQVI